MFICEGSKGKMKYERAYGNTLEQKRKMRVSHRYDRLPLLHSWPGGVQQELVVPAVQRYNNQWTIKNDSGRCTVDNSDYSSMN